MTYEGGGDGGEGEEVFRLALVAAVEASAARQPGHGPLHDPAVPAQALGRLDALAGETVWDAAGSELLPQVAVVVSLVAMQLAGPPASGSASGTDGRNTADHRDECLAVVKVGGGDADRQRQALAVHDEVDFRSPFAAVGRIRSRQLPPLRAWTLTESIAHRDQSRPPRAPSSSRTRRCSLAHTLACVHSVNRRKAVTPDSPKPGGSWFHVQPEVATKTIAASASRSPRRRCPPPCGRTGAGGTTRWNNVHNSSGAIRSTSAAVITPDCRKITPTEMTSKGPRC